MTQVTINLEPLRESIVNNLRTSICDIKFEKADGSLRILRGTLHPSRLPVTVLPEGESEPAKKKKTKNPESDAVSVYDLEANAWRSFKLTKFISIRIAEVLQ